MINDDDISLPVNDTANVKQCQMSRKSWQQEKSHKVTQNTRSRSETRI